MLVECITSGHGAAYFPLAEQFVTQSRPPLCGPATLAMVLNSLAVDPCRVWKAPWRWFSEEMLLACIPLDYENGITMEEFSHLAECNGTEVRPFVAGGPGASVDDFRESVRRSCSPERASTSRLAVNFSRAWLGQTGTSGHYSPIGAYHEGQDSVLVMDVARFKYPPFWVPVQLLWEAMREVDPATGRGRGFFEISKVEASGTSSGSGCSSCRYKRRNGEEGPRQRFQRLLSDLPAGSAAEATCAGAPLPGGVSTLVEAFVANSELVVQATRPLSHWLRTRLIQAPQEMELAMGELQRSWRLHAEMGRPLPGPLQVLWPGHPQKAEELTMLLVLACGEREAVGRTEPTNVVDHQAACRDVTAPWSEESSEAKLRTLVETAAQLMGIVERVNPNVAPLACNSVHWH